MVHPNLEYKERTEGSEPAFPRNHNHSGHNGLTKREYFAALAMQGIASTTAPDTQITDSLAKMIAKESVLLADELIDTLNR